MLFRNDINHFKNIRWSIRERSSGGPGGTDLALIFLFSHIYVDSVVKAPEAYFTTFFPRKGPFWFLIIFVAIHGEFWVFFIYDILVSIHHFRKKIPKA